MPDQNLPTSEDVLDAAKRLTGFAVRTPVIENQRLNEIAGGRVLIKPEVLQRTGSFKFRGAYNRLSQATDTEKKAGVVAWSSGNHAQGIAAAAQMLGLAATIVMPEDAPAIKIANTKSYGAEIRFYDRYKQDREEIGRAIAKASGAILVPSYDDPFIIAGQGTAALELFDDVDTNIDQLVIPCGGGGLTAGSVLARDVKSDRTKIYTVEPEGYDDHALSFAAGKRRAVDVATSSVCDALLTPTPGVMTFQINQKGVEKGLVVTEGEVAAAMAFAFTELKLVVEPGGAVALAAILSGKAQKPALSAIILSGGNVDPVTFWQLANSQNG